MSIVSWLYVSGVGGNGGLVSVASSNSSTDGFGSGIDSSLSLKVDAVDVGLTGSEKVNITSLVA